MLRRLWKAVVVLPKRRLNAGVALTLLTHALGFTSSSGQVGAHNPARYARALWQNFDTLVKRAASAELLRAANDLSDEERAYSVVNSHLSVKVQENLLAVFTHCGCTFGVVVWEYKVPDVYTAYIRQVDTEETGAAYGQCFLPPRQACAAVGYIGVAPCREGGSVWASEQPTNMAQKAMMMFFTPLAYYSQPNSIIVEQPVRGLGPVAHAYTSAVEYCMDLHLETGHTFHLDEFVSCVGYTFVSDRVEGQTYSAVRGFTAIPIIPEGVEVPWPGYFLPIGHVTLDNAKIMNSGPPRVALLPLSTFPDDELLIVVSNPIPIA